MGRGPSFSSGGGANLSLGAVGGPRGVGAGSIRALLQFVTTYDRGDLQKLEADLQGLKATQVSTQTALQAQLTKRINLEKNIQKAQDAQVLLGKQSKDNLAAFTKLQTEAAAQITVNGKRNVQTVQDLSAAQQKFVDGAVAAGELTQTQAERVTRLVSYENQLVAVQERLNALGQADIGIQGEIADKLTLQQTLMNRGAQLAGTLKSLLLGAVGGLVGGAIVSGVLFGPLQAGLDEVSTTLKDIIDPVNKAREAVKSLGAEINGLVSADTITRLEAAQKYIGQIQSPTAASGFSDKVLATAAQNQSIQELIDKINTYKDLVGPNGVYADQEQRVKALATALAQLAAKNGDVVTTTMDAGAAYKDSTQVIVGFKQVGGQTVAIVADMARYLQEAANAANDFNPSALVSTAEAAQKLLETFTGQQLDQGLTAFETKITATTDATIANIKRTTQANVDYWQSQAQVQSDAIQDAANKQVAALQKQSAALDNGDTRSGRTKSLQAQLNALQVQGPSSAVTALQKQIDALVAAQNKILDQRKLADDAEKRRLLLLQESLAASKTDIDISRYSGKERLVAINAELDLLKRRSDEQARFNKLLDIQYAISQGVKRSSGESISDFIGRRAQFYRDQLQQAAALATQQKEATLNADKDKVTAENALADLRQKDAQIRADRLYEINKKRLEKELAAQKQADSKSLTLQRQKLQEQLTASQHADQVSLEQQRQHIQDEINAIQEGAQDKIRKSNEFYKLKEQSEQNAANTAIKQAEVERDAAIQAKKDEVAAIKVLVDKSSADQQIVAIHQSKTLAQIYAYAGSIAGSGYSAALLKAQAQALGIPDAEISALLANANAVHDEYVQQFLKLSHITDPGGNIGPFHFAKGGFFNITNGMNFGQNMRAGEEGNELGWSDGRLGAILPHKIAESLKGAMGSGPMIAGGVTINRSTDPYRDYYDLKRTVTDIVDQRLSAR